MAQPDLFKRKVFDVSKLSPTYKEVKRIFQSTKERTKVIYPPGIKDTSDEEWLKHKDTIVKDNNPILESCRDRAGVYGIYVTDNGKAELKYVGQTTDKTSLMSIVNHLIYKHKDTGAQLESVRTAVVDGSEIELVFVEIAPKELREYVEHKLITDLTPNWNKKGK